MKELEKYLQELKWELRDLPEDVQTELMAEVQTHIEDGLEETAVTHTNLLQELGSPAELVRNLHWSNWKRNGRDAALAIIPLLLLDPLTVLIHSYLGITALSTILAYALNFLICVVLVLLARRLRSRLLAGWWLANTFGAIFSGYFYSFSWLSGTFWHLIPAVLVILVGGLYGRFLWQNRYDGLAITVALTPFMWGMIHITAIGPLLVMPGYEWRHFWTASIVANGLIVIALTAFIYPGRLQRWLLLSAWFTICTVGILALWLPNANAIFWLLLLLPFLLGLGIERAANQHYKQTVATASR